MTNKQTLAALQEALKSSDSLHNPDTRYLMLRTSVKALIAALAVLEERGDVCLKD